MTLLHRHHLFVLFLQPQKEYEVIKETMEFQGLMELMDFLDFLGKEVPRVKRVLKARQDGRDQWGSEGRMDSLVRRERGESLEFSTDQKLTILEVKEKKDLRVFQAPEDPKVSGASLECRVCLDYQE